MSLSTLERYLDAFARMRRNAHNAHGAAPHKPILLLALLQECDAGRITGNQVTITSQLVATFQTLWSALVPPDSRWKPRMAYPFWHLRSDGFWTLAPPLPEKEPSLKRLADQGVVGRFDAALWELMSQRETRAILRRHLFDVYFPHRTLTEDEAARSADRYLAHQKEELLNARFRLRPTVKERASEAYFLRSRLFPQVVKEQYGYACCVCRLSAATDESSVIDAAHILPFAEFHNDYPRNGLALCKNHHWGFDAGAWSLTDDGAVLASPRLAPAQGYVETGQPIAQPKDGTCRPDPAALRWHRKRWGFGGTAHG